MGILNQRHMAYSSGGQVIEGCETAVHVILQGSTDGMLSTPEPDRPNALLTRAVLFEISWKAKRPQLLDGML